MSLKITGVKEIIANISKVTGKMQKDGEKAIVSWAYDVAGEAALRAPADEGRLRSSIVPKVDKQKNIINALVVVQVDYAAYVEFGTKKYAAKYVATLPKEWKEYAATFKGSTDGSLDEFIQSIMAWVQRKGIGANTTRSGNTSNSAASRDSMQQAAYNIALNILQNGIKPSPYLYPAVRDNSKKLINELKRIYES